MTAIARRWVAGLGAIVGAAIVGASVAGPVGAAGPGLAAGLGAAAGAGVLPALRAMSPLRAGAGAVLTGGAAVALDALVHGVLGLGYPVFEASRSSLAYPGAVAALAVAVSAAMAVSSSRGGAPCAPYPAASAPSSGSD